MQINLRKASAIQAEIKRAISAVQLNDTVSVNEFASDAYSVVTNATLEFSAALLRKEQLTKALYNIRKSVAVANAKAGVSEILGDVELKDALIKMYEGIASTRAKMLDQNELFKRLEKIRNTPADQLRYGLSEVSSGVVSTDTINAAKATIKTLRKQKQNLQDELLTINVNTLIEVSELDAKVLGEEGIL